MGEWMPIETAPRDGRRILIIGGIWTEPEVALADGGWWARRKQEGAKHLATHWMPLPPPPSTEVA